MYLTATRSDIMHVVGLISKYMEYLKDSHLLATKMIFGYLWAIVNYGLFYKNGGKSDLTSFIVSDYAGDSDVRKSTSEYVFMLGSGVVS